MITLGITGSMGMGKSTVMQMLQDKGIPTFSADTIVHQALAMGGAAVPFVRSTFPDSFNNGAIDRRILSSVLYDDVKIKTLERIMHPIVVDAIIKFKDDMQAKGEKIIALDIPLLFETECDYYVDKILCISTTAETQKARSSTRQHMTPEKFAAIVGRPNARRAKTRNV